MERMLLRMFGIKKEELDAVFEEQPDFFEVCQRNKLRPVEVLKRFQGDPIAGALSFQEIPRLERFRLLIGFLVALWRTERGMKSYDIFAFSKLTEALKKVSNEEKELIGVLLPDAIMGEWKEKNLPSGLALQRYFLETDDLLSLRERLFEVYKVEASPEFKVGALFILASELASWLAQLLKLGQIQVIVLKGGQNETGR